MSDHHLNIAQKLKILKDFGIVTEVTQEEKQTRYRLSGNRQVSRTSSEDEFIKHLERDLLMRVGNFPAGRVYDLATQDKITIVKFQKVEAYAYLHFEYRNVDIEVKEATSDGRYSSLYDQALSIIELINYLLRDIPNENIQLDYLTEIFYKTQVGFILDGEYHIYDSDSMAGTFATFCIFQNAMRVMAGVVEEMED